MDPVYVMFTVWYRRVRFVCLKEFFEGRFRSLIFRLARCIPIDRENVSVDTLREIVGALKGGEVFVQRRVALAERGIKHLKEAH